MLSELPYTRGRMWDFLRCHLGRAGVPEDPGVNGSDRAILA